MVAKNETKDITTSEINTELSSNDKEGLRSFIKSNLSFYETALLLTIMDDFNFWNERCRNILNIKSEALNNSASSNNFNKKSYIKFRDFSKSIDNDIYTEIFALYSAIPINAIDSSSLNSRMKASKEIVLAMIANKCNNPNISNLNANDLIVAELRFKDIDAMRLKPTQNGEWESLKQLVSNGLSVWLEMRRMLQIAAYTTKNMDQLNANSLMQSIQSAMNQIESTSNTDSDVIQDFGQALDSVTTESEDDSMARMPIPGMPILTKALGGGLKRGETGLIIAGSGGGKTVAALQIASGVALMGYKSLVVTTEQHSSILSNRIIACNANIPFKKVKDGVRLDTLTEDEIDRIKLIKEPLAKNLKFANWCKTGEMIETNLEQLIKSFKEKDGLDVLVIDWLGGGLGVTAEQADKMHNYMMHCVNMIKLLAIKYNIFILVLAQANEKDAKSKIKLGRIDIDRCHTLDQPFTWALGISSVQGNASQRVNSPQESYLRKQYVNVWKGRMAGDLFYPIIREFEYQRFVEKELVELNNMPARQANVDKSD